MNDAEIQRLGEVIENLQNGLNRTQRECDGFQTRLDQSSKDYSDLYRTNKMRENELKSVLVRLFEDEDLDAEYAIEIANIFNITLTKTVTVISDITVTTTLEVSLEDVENIDADEVASEFNIENNHSDSVYVEYEVQGARIE